MNILQTATSRKILNIKALREGNKGGVPPIARLTCNSSEMEAYGHCLPKEGGVELPTAAPVAPVLTPSNIAW
jgi:hypothetical protein